LQDFETVAALFRKGSIAGVDVSESILDASFDNAEVPDKDLMRAYLTVCSINSGFTPLTEKGLAVDFVDPSVLQSKIATAADLVGIGCRVDTVSDNGRAWSIMPGCVFSNTVVTGVALIMSAVAFYGAKDRELNVTIECAKDEVYLIFRFKIFDGCDPKEDLDILKRSIEGNHSMGLELDIKEGEIFARLRAFYVDEGAYGEVKVPKPKLIY
jgi:hypothetical protein